MQNIAGCFQKTFENKKFVDITLQCFALLLQANLVLIFIQGKCDRIES